MERKVLGRGLEALIPVDSQGIKERVLMLKVSQVQASRLQPRLNFSQEKIQELANSIREKGVIQPVLVRAAGVDQYELIAGERRLRAVKHLGLTEIPAIVRRVADADLLEMSIIENIQREELNAVEEAKAYRRLAQEFGLTQDTIANRVGKDKSSISNLLRLLNLPEKIQDYLSKEFITFGHAKAILSLTDAKRQITFCEQIIERNLSVRQAEIAAGQRLHPKRKAARVGAPAADSHIRDLEERLQHALGTRVRVHHGKKRGKIEIEYYSLEDLDRVLALLGVK
jgi:ParB family chromosome partitioning protein